MISNAAFTELRELLETGQSDRARTLLLSLQAGYFTLTEEIQHLQLRVSNFEDMLACSRNVHHREGLVWLEVAGRQEGPFCPLCHGTDASLIRLEHVADEVVCPSCHARYSAPGAKRRKAALLPFEKGLQMR